MTECVKIKCDDCNFVEDCVDYGWSGCKKFTPAPSGVQTNEEWIKQCTTEQLAEFILNTLERTNKITLVVMDALINGMVEQKAIEVWLKEKHDG